MNFKRTKFAFILLLIFFTSFEAKAQRNYFDSSNISGTLTTESGSFNAGNYTASLITLFWSTSTVELKYSKTPFNKGTTTFIKVTLGSLSDVTVDAYYNGGILSKPEVKLVTSATETFLAVTPAADYNSLKITLVPQMANTATIHTGFNGHQLDCGEGWATSFTRQSSSGIPNVQSTVIGDILAVDADPQNNTNSTISVQGQQNVTVNVSQTIYFSSLGGSKEIVRLFLSEPAIADRKLSTATVQAFLNNKPVTKSPIDVVAEITSNRSIFPLEYSPEEPFDRITITVTLTTPANDNALKKYALNVYGAQIIPIKPVLAPSATEFCEETSQSISISNPATGLQYKWYDGNTLLANPLPTSYSLTRLSVGGHVLKVTASRPGCPESTPATINININPKPIKPTINTN